ncbi:hypothetical protein BDF14DRAFT_1726956, partial [Spinellus fusiger]
ESQQLEVIHHLLNYAHAEDGGWSIYIEGVFTGLGIALIYTCLRTLGLGPDHTAIVKTQTLHTCTRQYTKPFTA